MNSFFIFKYTLSFFRRLLMIVNFLTEKIKIRKEKSVFKVLKRKYKNSYVSYVSYVSDVSDVSDKSIPEDYRDVIWTVWLQGIDNAPELVKSCIASFSNLGEDKRILVVDKYNFHRYTLIPDIIKDRFEQGVITPTAFSEIIRLDLLARHGGLWLDATMYIPFGTRIKYQDYSFFSPKETAFIKDGDVFGLFPVFFIFCKKNYLPIIKIRDYIFSYWSNNDYQIDYFLIDYCFKMVYLEDEVFHEDVDKIPVIGIYLHFIDRYMMKKRISEGTINTLKSDLLGAYKLNYKRQYPLACKGVNSDFLTFYGFFIKNKGVLTNLAQDTESE